MPQKLPRFYLRQQKAEDEQRLAKILLETDSVDEPRPRLVNGADGHNWARRRGLPLISKGVRGTMPGTDPVAALLAKDPRRR